jgi:hypothetical protein
MDHLQDIDQGDILGEFGSNAPAPIQNRQTNMIHTCSLPKIVAPVARIECISEINYISY